jgi:hypothetical protein
MTRALPAAALALLVGAGAAMRPTPVPAPRAAPEDDERAERPVRFVEPASAMRKLAPLVGTWELRETWRQPRRYKRGAYEGEPGPGGTGTLVVREGPGGFSLLCDYEAHNPMGRVTALAVLAWDPERGAYAFDEIHSAFPGVLHLTGRFENGDLVLRGEDSRTGSREAVRLVWKGIGQDAWSSSWNAGPQRGRVEEVVATELHRAAAR